MLVLGIETSCDETACAVVRDAAEPARRIVSHSLFSQLREHAPYGGVVPEIASRAHIEHLDGLIAESLTAAGVTLADLDRSEEHTSELQSLMRISYAVFCLKKKKNYDKQ